MGYIYKITNQINNKAYIGQTIETPQDRWKDHIYTALSNKGEDNRYYFQKALRKYGIDNFTFEIIEQVDDSLLNEREIYWISYYHTYKYDDNHIGGYNLTRGGMGNRQFDTEMLIKVFYEHGENIKETISEIGCSELTLVKALKTKGLHGRGKDKSIYQLDSITGEILAEYPSIKEAAEYLQVKRGGIDRALGGRQLTAYSYCWCYKDKYLDFDINKHQDPRKRPVKCIETNTIFRTTADAGHWLGKLFDDEKSYITYAGEITNSCQHPTHGTHGYHWTYI